MTIQIHKYKIAWTLHRAINQVYKKSNKIEFDFSNLEDINLTYLHKSITKFIIDNNIKQKKYQKIFKIKNASEDINDNYQLALLNAFDKLKLINKGLDPFQFYTNEYAT